MCHFCGSDKPTQNGQHSRTPPAGRWLGNCGWVLFVITSFLDSLRMLLLWIWQLGKIRMTQTDRYLVMNVKAGKGGNPHRSK